jgi:hypothetical protein
VKVVAFTAPKQLPDTRMQKIRAPMGPRTWDPNATAMVSLVKETVKGRTRK